MTEGNKTTFSETRLENTIVCLPVASGSVAFYLGNKSDTQTHEWTLYVRGPSGEDLSVVLEKVIFQLHPSFAQPTRELTEPPYEVTERGWGEFEAQVRLIWKDPSEQSVLVCRGKARRTQINFLLHLIHSPTNAHSCLNRLNCIHRE
jgi:YEATS domain-containing protein 4